MIRNKFSVMSTDVGALIFAFNLNAPWCDIQARRKGVYVGCVICLSNLNQYQSANWQL